MKAFHAAAPIVPNPADGEVPQAGWGAGHVEEAPGNAGRQAPQDGAADATPRVNGGEEGISSPSSLHLSSNPIFPLTYLTSTDDLYISPLSGYN